MSLVDVDVQFMFPVPPTIPRNGLDLKPRVIENSTVFIDCPAIGVPDPQVGHVMCVCVSCCSVIDCLTLGVSDPQVGRVMCVCVSCCSVFDCLTLGVSDPQVGHVMCVSVVASSTALS